MSTTPLNDGPETRQIIIMAIVMLLFTLGVFLFLQPPDTEGEGEESTPFSNTARTRKGHSSGPGNPASKKEDFDLLSMLEWLNVDPEDFADSRSGEVLVRFSSKKALDDFLAKMRAAGIPAPRVSTALRTAMLNLDQLTQARDFLDKDDELAPNYYVTIPPLPEDGTIQDGAVGFGDALPAWLGAGGDRSQWGAGVRIAVIDSGINAHPNLPNVVRHIDLVEAAETSSHGTAVASLISGQSALAPGLAPAADLISVRIAGEDGLSSSFDLAEGIVAAVDAGAKLINISMGSAGDSVLVRDAVAYAAERGALLIAASGNNGADSVAYPAAYDGVVAVGAIDASGDILEFSNSGNAVSTAAPGLALNAAWQEEEYIQFTGTSASTGVVTGALAAIMTMDGSRTLSPEAAFDLYQSYSNEAGAPGPDPYYGVGTPDLSRVLLRDTPGIYDVALASQVLLPAEGDQRADRWAIVVENRGTEQLVNTSVDIVTPTNSTTRNITMLRPGETRVLEIVAFDTWFRPGSENAVTATVYAGQGITESRGDNNQRTDALVRE